MTRTRNRASPRRADTMPDQDSTSARNGTTTLSEEPHFAVVTAPTNSESAREQKQRVTVWCLIVLLCILSVIAGIMLWEKVAS